MKKFEYQIVVMSRAAEVKLDRMGSEGWRLVQILPAGSGDHEFIFEKEKAE